MQLLIHLIVLFIFVFALLMINLPKIQPNQHLRMKLYIFIGIFIFEFIVSFVTAIYKKCIINIGKIIRDSLLVAMISIVAYSLYTDLVFSQNPLVTKYNNQKSQTLLITIVITIFISIAYFIDAVLLNKSPGINDCINRIYQQN